MTANEQMTVFILYNRYMVSKNFCTKPFAFTVLILKKKKLQTNSNKLVPLFVYTYSLTVMSLTSQLPSSTTVPGTDNSGSISETLVLCSCWPLIWQGKTKVGLDSWNVVILSSRPVQCLWRPWLAGNEIPEGGRGGGTIYIYIYIYIYICVCEAMYTERFCIK